jgi:hypothetical protein
VGVVLGLAGGADGPPAAIGYPGVEAHAVSPPATSPRTAPRIRVLVIMAPYFMTRSLCAITLS